MLTLRARSQIIREVWCSANEDDLTKALLALVSSFCFQYAPFPETLFMELSSAIPLAFATGKQSLFLECVFHSEYCLITASRFCI